MIAGLLLLLATAVGVAVTWLGILRSREPATALRGLVAVLVGIAVVAAGLAVAPFALADKLPMAFSLVVLAAMVLLSAMAGAIARRAA